MFFGDDRRKVATIIKGRRARNGERSLDHAPMQNEEVRHEDGMIDGRHTAMENFMMAHREGSAQKMAEAMSMFMDAHHAMPSQSSEEPQD